MRWLLPIIALAGCVAEAAQSLGGYPNWEIDLVAAGSVTDWDPITVQEWARQCLVKNEHASATVYVGNADETGTADVTPPTTQDWMGIAPGAALSIPISGGGGTPITAERVVPIFSTTASHPVSFYCTSSSM